MKTEIRFCVEITAKLLGMSIVSAQRFPARPIHLVSPAAMPDVLTSTEAGYSGSLVNDWYGFSASAYTPKRVVSRLNAGFLRGLELSGARDRPATPGHETAGGSPDEFICLPKLLI